MNTCASNQWLHIVVPITGDDGGNVINWTFINQINLNVVDGYYHTPTNVMLGYANLEFTGAPGYPPVFSGLANPVNIPSGTPGVTLTGTVSGGNGNYLANGTLVSVTINGNTQTTAIDDNTGDFTINFTGLASLASASYPITYASASDYQIFVAGTNNATSLAVAGGGAASDDHAGQLDPTGRNLQISVSTSLGHPYYLLSATNLNPPVVWSTNTTTAGNRWHRHQPGADQPVQGSLSAISGPLNAAMSDSSLEGATPGAIQMLLGSSEFIPRKTL